MDTGILERGCGAMSGRRISSCLLSLLSLSLAIAYPGHAGADLTLTAAGIADGFHLSTFAYNFPVVINGGLQEGPLGIAFTPNNGVLVTDVNGQVFLFPSDADNQNAANVPATANYALSNAIGLARIGSSFYLTQQASNALVQVRADGTFAQSIVSVPFATGLTVNPNNGHLFVSSISNNQILDVNPSAKTSQVFVNANADGVVTDGSVLYAAIGYDHITGYRLSDGATVYTSSTINGVDGLALGTGVLKGFLFANTTFGEVYLINLSNGVQTLIANGGSRGDFATTDPNGSLLFTQSTGIVRLRLATPFDFDGDGRPDLLFQNTQTGQLVVWYMNGLTVLGGNSITPTQDPNWLAVGIGDFNGDGRPDILFQNQSTGRLVVWFMNGTAATGSAYITPAQNTTWKVFSVTDFNGDGKPDILFQNPATGQMSVWYLNGTTIASTAFLTPTQNPNWKAVGTGDFNRDGQPDILFQNPTTGQMAVWFMNGAAAFDGTFVAPAQNPNWQASAVADFDVDGSPDILFQNPTAFPLALWFLAGTNAFDGNYLTATQVPVWRVVGPK